MNIIELMNTNVVSCSAHDTLERAAQLMWEGDLGAVPVLDDAGHPIGLITDRDICIAAYTQGCRLSESQVASAMARELVTCKPTDSVGYAAELLRKYQVRRLPVVDGEKLVGMISLNDFASAATSKRGNKAGLDALGVTLARIGEPRRLHAVAAE